MACTSYISWKRVVISESLNFKTTNKQKLTCTFLSVRDNLKKKFAMTDPQCVFLILFLMKSFYCSNYIQMVFFLHELVPCVFSIQMVLKRIFHNIRIHKTFSSHETWQRVCSCQKPFFDKFHT